jgi:hypothetical protein
MRLLREPIFEDVEALGAVGRAGEKLSGSDAGGPAKFVASLFGVAA